MIGWMKVGRIHCICRSDEQPFSIGRMHNIGRLDAELL